MLLLLLLGDEGVRIELEWLIESLKAVRSLIDALAAGLAQLESAVWGWVRTRESLLWSSLLPYEWAGVGGRPR